MNGSTEARELGANPKWLWTMVFDTAIGACGIGWTALGVRAVQLPEGQPGAPVDLSRVEIDLTGVPGGGVSTKMRMLAIEGATLFQRNAAF